MATIHDVARLAGVSISTVSYTLSGNRSIAEPTRNRVVSAIQQLGYRPNAGARMLAGTRTHIFALTAPVRADTQSGVLMSFVLAVATAARKIDYDVLLLTADESATGLERVTSSRLADGIIALDVSLDDERMPLLRALDIPATVIGVPADTDGLVCVDLDFEGAAGMAVGRLADLGHRSIGLLGLPRVTYDWGANYPLRFRDGFHAAAAARGIDTAFVMPASDLDSIRRGLDELYAALPGMTALVMHAGESVQTAVLEILADRGISIPGDLSVLSACAVFDTSEFSPPLDEIPLSPEDSGTRAVELTLRQITGDRTPLVDLMPPRYLSRGSTGPAPIREP
jgi:DNA-binding LacI/PurR family transcriptional regulator